ncbi:MAG: hypothetical protein GY850_21795 [bacterium]|nr:hypothetical protein [bacterium]
MKSQTGTVASIYDNGEMIFNEDNGLPHIMPPAGRHQKNIDGNNGVNPRALEKYLR